MTRATEIWRKLRVGDWVRFIEYPAEFLKDGYVIFPETVRVYKKLAARRSSHRVWMIDEYGLPWIQCRFRRKNGSYEFHTLMVNHSGLAQVKPRRRKRKRSN